MIIVLLIVASTAAIVVPRMTNISASFEFTLNREGFEQMLSGLSYQAYRDNQDIVLVGEYTDQGRIQGSEAQKDAGDTLADNLRAKSLIATPIEHLPPINPFYFVPQLPAGWHMIVEDPIYFRGSGYCTGGKIDVAVGRAEYSYVLAPPLCHATLAE